MRNHSDDPYVWDSESAYFNGLGATATDTTAAPSTSTPSWWQNLLTSAGQTYAAVKQAQSAARPPAVAAPAPVAGSTPWGTYAMIGGGALLLGLLVFGKKRR